mgnify:CR=1 FL=1
MLFKKLVEIFRTKTHSQKKSEITCTECGHTYDNKIEECLQCWYLKIVEDETSDKKSDNLRVIKTIRGETAIKAAKAKGLKLLELELDLVVKLDLYHQNES